MWRCSLRRLQAQWRRYLYLLPLRTAGTAAAAATEAAAGAVATGSAACSAAGGAPDCVAGSAAGSFVGGQAGDMEEQEWAFDEAEVEATPDVDPARSALPAKHACTRMQGAEVQSPAVASPRHATAAAGRAGWRPRPACWERIGLPVVRNRNQTTASCAPPVAQGGGAAGAAGGPGGELHGICAGHAPRQGLRVPPAAGARVARHTAW